PYEEALIGEEFASAQDGEVAEIGLASQQFMGHLARLVAPRGGAILALDYGHAHTQPGETLQALSRHAPVDPLDQPGAADLTAHVDFQALGRAAAIAALTAHPLVARGALLYRFGLSERNAGLPAANP